MDGDGPQPLTQKLGRLSEEFGGALPSALLEEMDALPFGLLEQIVEARHYALAYQRIEAATTPALQKALPTTPLYQLVKQIDVELVLAKRKAIEDAEKAKAGQASRKRRRRRKR